MNLNVKRNASTRNKYVVQLHNYGTGEVVAVEKLTSETLQGLKGYIRTWIANGMSQSQFIIHIASAQVRSFLRQYAIDKSFVTCDCCGDLELHENMEFAYDSEDVCLAAICKDCTLN